jgi:peptidoglycan/xylan/chitin deacetylase (PgdA/CDA1 family)
MTRFRLPAALIRFSLLLGLSGPCLLLGLSGTRAEEPAGTKHVEAKHIDTNPAPCPAGALGTSRVLSLDTKGRLALGLKTYPQSLDLADHEVVLTFDDGPWPATTPSVLDALAQQCVKATFFLIGRNAQAAPDLVQRELAAGHTLGHHSFSHPAATLRGLSDAAARQDIDKGFEADDKAAYGKAESPPKVPFFRFPGFADTPELVDWLASRNIAVFGADLWAFDWLPLTPQAELDRVLNKLEKEKRGILLLHDTHRSTAAMLPELLIELKRRGFKIVHIVPGTDAPDEKPPALRQAPAGWTSETEAIIRRIRPKLALPNATSVRDFTRRNAPPEAASERGQAASGKSE